MEILYGHLIKNKAALFLFSFLFVRIGTSQGHKLIFNGFDEDAVN